MILHSKSIKVYTSTSIANEHTLAPHSAFISNKTLYLNLHPHLTKYYIFYNIQIQ